MPRSYPPIPDVRVLDPGGPPIIDAIQAVTGGDTPYCRRCGQTDTIRPQALSGLLDAFPPHECGTTPEEPFRGLTLLNSPFL